MIHIALLLALVVGFFASFVTQIPVPIAAYMALRAVLGIVFMFYCYFLIKKTIKEK